MYLPIETEQQQALYDHWYALCGKRVDHEFRCLNGCDGRDRHCDKGLEWEAKEQAAHTAYRAACETHEEVAA